MSETPNLDDFRMGRKERFEGRPPSRVRVAKLSNARCFLATLEARIPVSDLVNEHTEKPRLDFVAWFNKVDARDMKIPRE